MRPPPRARSFAAVALRPTLGALIATACATLDACAVGVDEPTPPSADHASGVAPANGASAAPRTPGVLVEPPRVPTDHLVWVAEHALVFSPETLTIHAGDSVTWVFMSDGHSVSSGFPGRPDEMFCSPDDRLCSVGFSSPAGTRYTHVFPDRGTYPYFDAENWQLLMTGAIVVEP